MQNPLSVFDIYVCFFTLITHYFWFESGITSPPLSSCVFLYRPLQNKMQKKNKDSHNKEYASYLI